MQLDDNFYAGLGRQLSESEKQSMAQKMYSELEERVGEKLESQLSDQQAEEFESLIDKGPDGDLETWLEANAPGYEQLTQDVFEQIKREAAADPAKYL
jgi:succinate dehydrogenase flavin-adding protein (antitoxin of CptAB toxin-antitoxin module)